MIRLEKIFFYLLVFGFFLQKRFVWQLGGGNFNEWMSVYFYVTDILIIGLIFLWFLREGKGHKWKNFLKTEFFKKIESALFVFLAIAGLSIFITQNKILGLYTFVKLFEFILLFLYIKNNFIKLFNWQKFWQFFIAGASVQSAIALMQFFTQKSLGLKILAESPLSSDIAGVAKITVGSAKIVRAYGLVPHPNILAAILIVAIFGLVWLFLEKYKQFNVVKKGVFGVISILLSSALFFTFSRAVIFIGFFLLIVWAAIIFLRQKNYRRPLITFLFLLFFVNCFLLIVYWTYFFSRFDLQVIKDSQSLNLRIFYNWAAWNFFKDFPLLGVGFGNFVSALTLTYNKLPSWMFQPVHNIYLLILTETGIFGLLAFLRFLFLTVKDAWRKRNDFFVGGLLFIVFCFLFFCLFDHFFWDIQQGQIMFWLFLGLLAGLGPCSSLLAYSAEAVTLAAKAGRSNCI